MELLCQHNNIKFELFLVPKQANYTKYFLRNSLNEYAAFNKKVSALEVKAPIFGKFDIFDKLGDSVLFADPYHLNEMGQTAFTKLFYELTLAPREGYSVDYSWFSVED